jgi:hypothetical protein
MSFENSADPMSSPENPEKVHDSPPLKLPETGSDLLYGNMVLLYFT